MPAGASAPASLRNGVAVQLTASNGSQSPLSSAAESPRDIVAAATTALVAPYRLAGDDNTVSLASLASGVEPAQVRNSNSKSKKKERSKLVLEPPPVAPPPPFSSDAHGDGAFAERRRVIPAAQLTVGKTVGEGSFGRVYRGSWRRRTVAVKCLFDANLFTEEAQLLSMLSHRNVVRYLGESPPPAGRAASDSALGGSPSEANALGAAVADAAGIHGSLGGAGAAAAVAVGQPAPMLGAGVGAMALSAARIPRCGGLLITEFCSGGTLHDHIYSTDAIKLETAMRWMLEVVQGLAYLHSEGPARILHLDLKPLNVLLNSRGVCKLADLGTAMRATRLGDNNFIEPIAFTDQACKGKGGGAGAGGAKQLGKAAAPGQRRAVQGTVRYMAPELIRGERITDRADVWSFGVICTEILSRDLPFRELTNNLTVTYRVGSTGCAPTLPPSTPSQLREIIESCFRPAFADRPGSSSLRHALEDIFCAMPEQGGHAGAAPLSNGFRLLQLPAEAMPPDLYVAPPGSSGASVFQSTGSSSESSRRASSMGEGSRRGSANGAGGGHGNGNGSDGSDGNSTCQGPSSSRRDSYSTSHGGTTHGSPASHGLHGLYGSPRPQLPRRDSREVAVQAAEEDVNAADKGTSPVTRRAKLAAREAQLAAWESRLAAWELSLCTREGAVRRGRGGRSMDRNGDDEGVGLRGSGGSSDTADTAHTRDCSVDEFLRSRDASLARAAHLPDIPGDSRSTSHSMSMSRSSSRQRSGRRPEHHSVTQIRARARARAISAPEAVAAATAAAAAISMATAAGLSDATMLPDEMMILQSAEVSEGENGEKEEEEEDISATIELRPPSFPPLPELTPTTLLTSASDDAARVAVVNRIAGAADLGHAACLDKHSSTESESRLSSFNSGEGETTATATAATSPAQCVTPTPPSPLRRDSHVLE